MRRIDQLLSKYEESHQNKLNKRIHWVCVPLILFGALGLLWSLPRGVLSDWAPAALQPVANWAVVTTLLLALYYLRLSLSLTVGMLAVVAVMCLGAHAIHEYRAGLLWQVSLAVFVVAWIAQFYGHKVEAHKPAFLDDLQFLLIGPAWVMSFVFKKVGLKY